MFIPEIPFLLMVDNIGSNQTSSSLEVQSDNVCVVSINKTMKLPLNGNIIMDRKFYK